MDSRKPTKLKPLLLTLLFAAGIIIIAASLKRPQSPSPSAAAVPTNTAPPSATTDLGNAHATNPPGYSQPPATVTTILPTAAPSHNPASDGKQADTSRERAYTRRSILDPLEMMKQSLDLTDEQAKKLGPVIK